MSERTSQPVRCRHGIKADSATPAPAGGGTWHTHNDGCETFIRDPR